MYGGEELVMGGDPAAAQRIMDEHNERARRIREMRALEAKAEAARVVPDIAGRDIGGTALRATHETAPQPACTTDLSVELQ